jgi:uncharacterized phiE125 gp8 family phage protein
VGLSIVTPPASDPVSLAEAKTHLRITAPDEDALIVGYLLAAREHVETITRRALLTQTWDYSIDAWADRIVLPKPPVQSVTSISYLDQAGATQTLSAALYRLVKQSTGEWAILKAYNAVWPAVQTVESCITIRFVCGYGTPPGSIPEAIRQAILLLVGHWFANREAVNVGNIVNELPLGVEPLLFPHRVFY